MINDEIVKAAKALALEEEKEAEKLFEELDTLPNPVYSEEFKFNMEKIIRGDNCY